MLKYYAREGLKRKEVSREEAIERIKKGEEMLVKDDSVVNESSTTKEVFNKVGRAVSDFFKDAGEKIGETAKDVKEDYEESRSGKNRTRKLLKVLPYLSEEDIHELISSEIEKEDSFEYVNIAAFMPFLSSKDCDALFIRAIKDGLKKSSIGSTAPFVSDECLSKVADMYINGELKNIKIEDLYPFLSLSDVKRIVIEVLKQK